MPDRRKPGAVRDAILSVLQSSKDPMTTVQIHSLVEAQLGGTVSASSVRSYLNLNTPGVFIRTGPGVYRLVRR